MNYPDDFNVPTFSAGKSVAVSRAMGIGIMSGFLIIIFLCGILLWTMRSVRVEPFVLATDGINDEWKIITAGGDLPEIKMTSAQVVQESLVWNFVQDWFSVSSDDDINMALWDTSCARTDCDAIDGTQTCKIFCTAGDALFSHFKEDVLPTYESYADVGEFWSPIASSIRMSPIGIVSNAGGTWRIQMIISTSRNENMTILAYAKVARNTKYYPKTMGYYIVDFNAYRMN